MGMFVYTTEIVILGEGEGELQPVDHGRCRAATGMPFGHWTQCKRKPTATHLGFDLCSQHYQVARGTWGRGGRS